MYVIGLRVHHGLTGCVLLSLHARGVAGDWARTLGLALVLHDARDFPFSLRD